MPVYYQYYDHNGRSIHVEMTVLAGPDQSHTMPRGAQQLSHDEYVEVAARIDHAQQAAEREADAIGRFWTPPEPPDGGDHGGEGDWDETGGN